MPIKRPQLAFVSLLLSVGLGATSCGAAQAPSRGVPARAVSAAHAPWRYPAMRARIRASGQRVVGQREVVVPANAPWIGTGLSVTAGERLWIDTRSDGTWSGNPRFFPYSDANGLALYPGQYRVDARARVLSLIGFVGASPPTPQQVEVNRSAHPGGPGGLTSPGLLEVGNTLKDHLPRTRGKVWLRNNDNTNYISDVGRQIVRVLVTARA